MGVCWGQGVSGLCKQHPFKRAALMVSLAIGMQGWAQEYLRTTVDDMLGCNLVTGWCSTIFGCEYHLHHLPNLALVFRGAVLEQCLKQTEDSLQSMPLQ